MSQTIPILAERLGFATTPDFKVSSIPRTEVVEELAWNFKTIDKSREAGLEGIYDGKKFHLADFCSGLGKSSVSWGEIAVAVEAAGFRFSLRPADFDTKLSTMFGDNSIKTGDKTFDVNWQIDTPYIDILRAMLTPELRVKIDNMAVRSRGVFILENNWLRYKEQGDLSSVAWTSASENTRELMSDLADALEIAVKAYSPIPALPTSPPGYDDEKKDSDWGEASPDYDRSP